MTNHNIILIFQFTSPSLQYPRIGHHLDKEAKMDQLNPREQQEFQQLVEQKQMKDFMRVCDFLFICIMCLQN